MKIHMLHMGCYHWCSQLFNHGVTLILHIMSLLSLTYKHWKIYFTKYRALFHVQNHCSFYEFILDSQILKYQMILYFYLKLGTSYLNTSSVWDEHSLEKYLPIESCQRWSYKTKLPLRTTDYLTGIPVTAVISLLSQWNRGHNDQWLHLVMELPEASSQVEYYYSKRHYLRHWEISVLRYHYQVRDLWKTTKTNQK